MTTETTTKPSVFIIESLRFQDEDANYFEGQVISNILNFADVEHKYYYIRTKAELVRLLEEFNKLNYRYLHISMHGNRKSLGTTLDDLPFKELSFILESSLDKKRLFVSACSAVNKSLATEIFGLTDCFSVIGPHEDIDMDDAAIFWASFYHLMFKKNNKVMKRDILEATLKALVKTHKIPITYFTSSRSSDTGFKKVTLK
jgi:hypothetical protein